MLVLSRRDGEKLVLKRGDEFIIVYVTRDGRYTRVGIDAPPEWKIYKEEKINKSEKWIFESRIRKRRR